MYLSASRIKSYIGCSWTYWVTYHLKFRDMDASNDGAKRGTICHLILECLILERRRKQVFNILTNGLKSDKAVCKLIDKHAKILNVNDENNMNMIHDFIIVGLKSDFYCAGWDLQPAEKRFIIEPKDENDRQYKIMGFIDKHALKPEEGKARVDDYKSSKQKFSGKDNDFNIQGLTYALALWKEGGYKEIDMNFVFLKFPKSPFQSFTYNENQLKGFEIFLEETYKYLSNFNIKKAVSNFGKFNGNSFICGKRKGDLKKDGSPAHICQWKDPFIYYQLTDENGNILKTSKEEGVLEAKEGQTVKEVYYAGCPAFYGIGIK